MSELLFEAGELRAEHIGQCVSLSPSQGFRVIGILAHVEYSAPITKAQREDGARCYIHIRGENGYSWGGSVRTVTPVNITLAAPPVPSPEVPEGGER